MNDVKHSSSPPWSSTTKLVVGLSVAALLIAFLIYFRSIIGPMLLAIILAYLLHPIVAYISNFSHLSWRVSTTLMYVVLLLLVAGLSTVAGLAVVQQSQSLLTVLERFLKDLPGLLEQVSLESYAIGPFTIDLSQFSDIGVLGDQIISGLQLLIGQAGNLVGTFASGAASTVGWGAFVFIVSFFLLAEAGKVPDAITYLDLPGYTEDIRRIGRELGRIWNIFMRGQLIIVIMVVVAYTILFSILGVRYSFAIAALAGLARFIPWLGPFATYATTALVTIFQGSNYFGLEPIYYAILVILLAIALDQVFDNVVVPRFMGSSLNIHPAALLVTAIVAANLIGIIGLLLAAPVLASVNLIGRYTTRKMFDQDPWPESEGKDDSMPLPRLMRLRAWWRTQRKKK